MAFLCWIPSTSSSFAASSCFCFPSAMGGGGANWGEGHPLQATIVYVPIYPAKMATLNEQKLFYIISLHSTEFWMAYTGKSFWY